MPRKKTIVILGRFRPGTSEEGLQHGFRSAGWITHAIDTRQTTGAPGNNRLSRVTFRAHEFFSYSSVVQELIQTVESLRPDIVLMVKRTDLTADTMKHIRSIGCKIILFYPDFHFNHRTVNESLFVHFDTIITTKTFQINYLKEKFPDVVIQYVPHGYVENVHQPIVENLQEQEYERDLLYSGNHSKYKETFLKQLVTELTDTDFLITGPNWNGKDRVLQRYVDKIERRNALYSEAIQLSRINIAIFAGTEGSNKWQDQVSTRTFEIPAARGFMLHIDNDEVRSFYKVGMEIDVFTTPEECAEKIRYYVDRPKTRMEMIEKAYQRAVPSYSYTERALQIINLLYQ